MKYRVFTIGTSYKPLPRFEQTCCLECKHFNGIKKGTCAAYPNGIPDKFAIRNASDFMETHVFIEPGQVGEYVFTLKTT